MYLSRRDKALLKVKAGTEVKTSLEYDDDWKTKALNKLTKEGFFTKKTKFDYVRTDKPVFNNLDKARIIASNTFLSGEDDPLEKYEKLEKADPFSEASDHVEVWQPFENWRVGELLEVMDTLTNEIITSFELNPDKV